LKALVQGFRTGEEVLKGKKKDMVTLLLQHLQSGDELNEDIKRKGFFYEK
jgi:hypothetical protein